MSTAYDFYTNNRTFLYQVRIEFVVTNPRAFTMITNLGDVSYTLPLRKLRVRDASVRAARDAQRVR